MYKSLSGSRAKLETNAEHLLKRVFIVSATMCRPIQQMGHTQGQQRAPTYKEIKSCAPRLSETIYAVDPLIILCFGSHARSAVFAKRPGLDTRANKLEFVDLPGKFGIGVRYSVLLAPALSVAEEAGDYNYTNGKTQAVRLALTKAFSLVDAITAEDHP